MRAIDTADLFCGAGGFTTGLMRACKRLGLQTIHTVVNHWNIAIATHNANHPDARHLCASLGQIEPRKATQRNRLRVLLASPECTFHSRAGGDRPINDQSRTTAWEVLRWLQELYVDDLVMENVTEFVDWAPLGANGKPIKSMKGDVFRSFVGAIKALNYAVDWRFINAADFGDATTRTRLILRARRGRHSKITWPEPTHAGNWKPAGSIIDWSLHGRSIFNRKVPLKPNTIARIEQGIRQFWGEWAEPFLVILRRNGGARSIHDPIPTLCAGGNHVALVTAKPFVIRHAQTGNKNRLRDIEEPMPTLTGTREFALVTPFIVPQMSGGAVRSVTQPVPTITTTSRGIGLVRPFWLNYFSNGKCGSIDEPVSTITCRDRLALVTPRSEPHDILYRMFQPHELSAAMGFPSDYQFHGTREDQVKQIGNAVAVGLAEAHCFEALSA